MCLMDMGGPPSRGSRSLNVLPLTSHTFELKWMPSPMLLSAVTTLPWSHDGETCDAGSYSYTRTL